jgi:hypothetical protein
MKVGWTSLSQDEEAVGEDDEELGTARQKEVSGSEKGRKEAKERKKGKRRRTDPWQAT